MSAADHNLTTMIHALPARDRRGAVDTFRALVGRAPDQVWASPGRVNLVGEHTDYNGGLVLPVAIDRWAVVAAGVRDDGVARCASLQRRGVVQVSVERITTSGRYGWAAPVLGALWAMRRAGLAVPGIDLVVDSGIPIGAGLASSAALEVATVLATSSLTGREMSIDAIARCCQAGEEAVAGAPTGLMDPVAVLAGRRGCAVFLDCRSLERTLVPFEPGAAGATLVVIQTAVAHRNSAPGYRERRRQCEQAAAALGLASLRDATAEAVASRLSGVLQQRARHVVTENARVRGVVELLCAGNLAAVGPILNESHSSLRDDFEVSCAELDCAVESAMSAGAWGARMTGAGFGGSAIALVPTARRDALTDAVLAEFARRGHAAPRVFAVASASGAARVG